MGSIIEINDTLQITKAQGFPRELDITTHLENPYRLEDYADKVFEFKDKDGVRVFQSPPVRVFLAENIDGKWLYWGQCHILEVTCDYQKKTTSGKFQIIYLYTPEEMKTAHQILDRDNETDYFNR